MKRQISSGSSSRSISRKARPALELLEVRRLMAIVVNTTLDETVANATTSLREAVAQADANPGDDTITFDPTVFDSGSLHTITLTQGEMEIAATDGKVTIQGPGSDVLAIDAGGASGIFRFDTGTSGDISGMKLMNGKQELGGQAIFTDGTLSLSNMVFTSNSAVGSDGADGDSVTPGGGGQAAYGGAVYNDTAGQLTIDSSTFSTNSATGGKGGSAAAGGGNGGSAQGGAIYNGNAMTVSNSTFSNNSVTAGAAGQDTNSDANAFGGIAFGGAISAQSFASGSITLCTFTSNIATAGAGADSPTVASQGANAEGGAVYVGNSAFTVDQSDFETNAVVAGNGGNGSTKGGGGGQAYGGGLYFDAGGTVTNSGFDGNSVTGGDAGTGATASEAGSADGGGVASFTSLLMQDCTLSSNSANGGDATAASSGGGTSEGGGLFVSDGGTIQRCTFSANVSTGGGSLLAGPGQGNGGGIETEKTVSIEDSTITGNFATATDAGDDLQGGEAFGGGIDAPNGALTLSRDTIDHNFATGSSAGQAVSADGKIGGTGDGGGIAASASLAMTDSTVAFNTATGGPGGDSIGAFAGGDGADGQGGGLYLDQAIGNVILNCTIDSNSAVGGAGGAGNVVGLGGRGQGGNIFSFEQLNPQNTIIGDGTADTGPDLFGTFAPVNSLITSTADATVTGSNNIIAQPTNLGPLTDNGGFTETMLPNQGSAAIDNGDSTLVNGVLSVDQRGLNRVAGANVDIGSVETGVAVLSMTGNGVTIVNNDATPSILDFTNYGSDKVNNPIDHTFVITNTGTVALNLGFLDLPLGFSAQTPFAPTVDPGDSTSFTVRFQPASVGSFGGPVTISDNENNTLSHFVFNIAGTSQGATTKINFQPLNSEPPDGYLIDGGQSFAARGNGYSYGWNQSITSGTRERDVNVDQRLDTVVHMQLYGVRTWEIAVPNGNYQVHLVAGDPSYTDSVYKINVEGVLTVNGTPTKANHFVEGTKTVTVSDGRLTISNATGSVNDKLDYVEITPVAATTKINFQTPASPTPAGFLADSGATYGNRGNGQTYGWNQSATSFSRDRNAKNSPDQQHDTFIHTELYGNRTWEIAEPNGSYNVDLVAGDPSYADSVYKYNVEGVLALSGTPTAANHWIEGMVTVVVSDGKLTLTNASGSVNNKIDYITITPA